RGAPGPGRPSGPALAVVRTGATGHSRRCRSRPVPVPRRGRQLERRGVLRPAAAAAQRGVRHRDPAACGAAGRGPRDGPARGGDPAAGERREAVAVRAQPACTLPLALARKRGQRVGTAGLAPAPAPGRAGARSRVPGPGTGLVAAVVACAPAGRGAARGLPAARGEAGAAAHPGPAAARPVHGHRRDGMSGVEIHTDGACLGNPGAGGWAALLRYGEQERELAGGEPATTNNRMELMAAIMALETLTRPCEVVLHTDSQYVRQGITLWMPNWVRRGWKTSAGDPVKNRDLWERLHAACARHDI